MWIERLTGYIQKCRLRGPSSERNLDHAGIIMILWTERKLNEAFHLEEMAATVEMIMKVTTIEEDRMKKMS